MLARQRAKVRHPDRKEESFEYDVIGNLTSATNSAGTVKFEREALRRLVGDRFGEEWVASTLDSLGQRVEVKTSKR